MSQTAVITGATSGIGAAYARRLAADGYDLIITGRRKEIIQKLADDIAAQHKVKVKLIIAELSVDSDIQKVIDAIKTDGNVAMLINNAGYAGDLKPLMDMKLADCEQMVKVHQVATLRLIYAVVPDMVKRGKGAIINLSSIAAYMPMPGGTLYGGSKAFLKMFSEALHMDLKDKGIKVQALCPGFIPTDFYRGFTEDEYKKATGSFKKIPAEAVVDYSLKCLKKGKVVCVTGASYKMMCTFLPLMPRSIYYKIAANIKSR